MVLAVIGKKRRQAVDRLAVLVELADKMELEQTVLEAIELAEEEVFVAPTSIIAAVIREEEEVVVVRCTSFAKVSNTFEEELMAANTMVKAISLLVVFKEAIEEVAIVVTNVTVVVVCKELDVVVIFLRFISGAQKKVLEKLLEPPPLVSEEAFIGEQEATADIEVVFNLNL